MRVVKQTIKISNCRCYKNTSYVSKKKIYIEFDPNQTSPFCNIFLHFFIFYNIESIGGNFIAIFPLMLNDIVQRDHVPFFSIQLESSMPFYLYRV